MPTSSNTAIIDCRASLPKALAASMVALRRSQRTASADYDSNGRQYLASVLGWSRSKLDGWLLSKTVRPHLTVWYNLCYIGGRRFNDGVDWINTGDNGYYYNPSDLEEDLLLLCLGEGNVEDMDKGDVKGGYGDEKASTYDWTTQELWARTAWRIVQSNRGPGQAFETLVLEHPPAAYGFVIDTLCLAFHSLAFRRSESVWEDILNRPIQFLTVTLTDDSSAVPIEVVLDRDPNEVEEEVKSEAAESIASSELSTIVEDDGEFEDPETPKTPPNRKAMASPKAPRKPRSIDKSVFLSEEQAQRVNEWMESVREDPMALDLRDESGVPITGYRMAAPDLYDGMEAAWPAIV